MFIVKEFTFEAAHKLPALPLTHKCSRMHGHSYRVELFVEGPLDERTGMIADYDDLEKKVAAPVREQLDHRYLNEIPGLENPTTEVLALWILGKVCGIWLGELDMARVTRLRVYESNTTFCEVP